MGAGVLHQRSNIQQDVDSVEVKFSGKNFQKEPGVPYLIGQDRSGMQDVRHMNLV